VDGILKKIAKKFFASLSTMHRQSSIGVTKQREVNRNSHFLNVLALDAAGSYSVWAGSAAMAQGSRRLRWPAMNRVARRRVNTSG
jgi:hypothetical protein